MSHARLQWSAVLFTAAVVGLFELARHQWHAAAVPGVWGDTAAALVAGAAVYAFVRYFIRLVANAERQLGRVRAEAAVLAERQRIGRDMHDSVAQALFLVRVTLDELEADLAGGRLEAARARASALGGQIGRADDQVRAVIGGLKRQAAAEDSAEALRREATRVAADLGLELTFTLDELPGLDAAAGQHLTALLSEALANAARHGGATRVAVTGGRDRLVITDNGTGFLPRPEAGRGFGLVIMAERAELVGGRLDVASTAGQGTRLTVTFGGAGR